MSRILQNGDQIDKYRVECCLGAGGMGEVYLVSHQYLNVKRAMKVLRMNLTENDPTFRDRFVREARIAARFQHPNSISVVDVESSSESGFLYLVMEYVDGQSLHQYLQLNRDIVDEMQMLRICRDVASALDAAWNEMKLVHRDIKPGNIMLTNTGEVKLADLGIAKSSGGSGMTMALTMEGSMIGTPEYASPEQCLDASSVDTRADIYSLGATLYEMLTGVRPFQGADTFETVDKVLNDDLVPVRKRNRNISRKTAALVERMMEKEPEDRPQTMSEVVAMIDRILGEKDSVPDKTATVKTEMDIQIREQAEKTAEQKMTQVQTGEVQKKRNRERVMLLCIGYLTLLICGMNLYVHVKHWFKYRRAYNIAQQLEQTRKKKDQEDFAVIRQALQKPGIILGGNNSILLHYNPENPQVSYTIPDGVRTLQSLAFDRCHNLQNVICPDSVVFIAKDAFRYCYNLKTVSVSRRCSVSSDALPSNVKLIRRGRR
ncbi:MAG: protein kinase [Lentisphaeria bacterium]|nr:protein kinase [Lentisphaeria bacterium]